MGEQIKELNVNIDGAENLKRGTGVQIDSETNYDYAGEFSTDGVPLIDPGTGKTVSIRVFTFKIDPSKLRLVPKDKQKLFNDHSKFIEKVLWGDGLIRLDGVNPRVIINKKGLFYQIFVPCEAKRGVMFMDKPHNLTKLLAEEAKRGHSKPQSK